MIDWVIEAVGEAGATDVKIVVSSHHAEVAAHVDTRAQVVYQRESLGTGHAVRQVPAEDLSRGDVLVVYGDSPLLRADSIRRVIEAHRQAGGPATLASVEDPRRDDGRIVRGPDGSLERIVESKDATDEIRRSIKEFNVGLYCFNGKKLVEALEKITNENKAEEYYLPDVLPHLKPVTVVRLDDPDEAIGINDRITLATAIGVMRRRIVDRLMLGGVTIVDPASTFVDATVAIGEDTVVEPFTVLKGKTVIGQECRIGPHAHIEDARIGDRSDCGPFVKIRAGTEVAEDVHIGSFAELVRTRIGRGSRVPHVSYLGDTDLGEDANVGAGTITANFNGEVKNRTQIGDGAFIGVDTMLVAPVKLGKGARTGAGSVVTRDVPDGATAVGVPARVIRRKSVSSDGR
jgi:bifunctional UDP-N-acetylglucosamine pyrophosphorylase/glucosamine-1-phosphate N-acetyltransferase